MLEWCHRKNVSKINEDVLFRWWLISVDFDDAISAMLSNTSNHNANVRHVTKTRIL